MTNRRKSPDACFLLKKWKEFRKVELMIKQKEGARRRAKEAKRLEMRKNEQTRN
jgi:hypothetical protein